LSDTILTSSIDFPAPAGQRQHTPTMARVAVEVITRSGTGGDQLAQAGEFCPNRENGISSDFGAC
jgi:hypothetical protein